VDDRTAESLGAEHATRGERRIEGFGALAGDTQDRRQALGDESAYLPGPLDSTDSPRAEFPSLSFSEASTVVGLNAVDQFDDLFSFFFPPHVSHYIVSRYISVFDCDPSHTKKADVEAPALATSEFAAAV
jgi:hypothetical protein